MYIFCFFLRLNEVGVLFFLRGFDVLNDGITVYGIILFPDSKERLYWIAQEGTGSKITKLNDGKWNI